MLYRHDWMELVVATDIFPQVELGPLCSKIGSGATPRGGSKVYLDEGEIALIRSQNVYNDGFNHEGLVCITAEHAEQLSNVIVEPEDVLLNITGDSVARCCQVDPHVLPARVNQHVSIIRTKPDELNPQFLRYFLVSPAMQAQMLSWAHAGATRKALTKGMIESFRVPKPDLPIQKRIASILGTLDDKIELNRRMNETLEGMARAIFKSWFVDFDPVRAKAEGRDPRLSKAIADLFPDELEDSELGEIPKGWKPSTIGYEFSVTMGQSPPGKTYNEIGDGLPFFQGRRDFGFRFPTNRVYCTAPRRLADHGDTLVSVRAPVGDINMAMARCCVGRGVAGIRHKSGSRSYTYHAMHILSNKFARFEGEGTVFGAINRKQFEGLRWLSPPGDLVSEFERMVFPFDERIEEGVRETMTLAAIRDALLPKLISGEIRVRDVEKVIEEAV